MNQFSNIARLPQTKRKTDSLTGDSAQAVFRYIPPPAQGRLMFIEFFGQGKATPTFFDIFVNTDGSIQVMNPAVMRKVELKVLLAEAEQIPTPPQILTIYAMLRRYSVCTVAFYGMDI